MPGDQARVFLTPNRTQAFSAHWLRGEVTTLLAHWVSVVPSPACLTGRCSKNTYSAEASPNLNPEDTALRSADSLGWEGQQGTQTGLGSEYVCHTE